jgi:ubiquitin carboxyl-terminal hydrolase 7
MDEATPPTGALANLNLQDDIQNPGTASPNTVMADAPEELVVEPNGTETEDVAIINPDAMDTAGTTLLASDCMLAPPSARPVADARHADSPQMRP